MVSASLLEPPASEDVDALDLEPADSFNIFVASLKLAGFTEMLANDADYTLFAPTDDAFAKLPDGMLARVIKDKHELRAMLQYHMVPGRITSDQIRKMASATTLEGHPVNIRNCSTCTKVWINEAEIVDADICASNGVVHAIDAVLRP